MNIGDFDKIIPYICLNLQLGGNLMCVLPKWYSRYESQSTSVEYVPISALSFAEYSYWQHRYLPIPLVVTLSTTVFVYGYSLAEAGTLIMKSAIVVT